MRVSGAYADDRLERFAAMDRSKRLGNLASNLARLAAYSKNRRPLEAAYAIAREARYFAEICAATEADPSIFCEIDKAVDAAMGAFERAQYPPPELAARIAACSESLMKVRG